MNTVKATGEYGIIIRQEALSMKKIHKTKVFEAMEVEQPLDSNQDLISFGPAFGPEALNEFISRLQALGLEYVDDFFALSFDFPSWCCLRIGVSSTT